MDIIEIILVGFIILIVGLFIFIVGGYLYHLTHNDEENSDGGFFKDEW